MTAYLTDDEVIDHTRTRFGHFLEVKPKTIRHRQAVSERKRRPAPITLPTLSILKGDEHGTR